MKKRTVLLNIGLYSCQPWDYVHGKSSFPYFVSLWPAHLFILHYSWAIVYKSVTFTIFPRWLLSLPSDVFPTKYLCLEVSPWPFRLNLSKLNSHTHTQTPLLHTYIQILPFRDTTVHSCVSWKSGISSPSLSSFRLNLPFSSVLPVQCSLSPPTSLFPMHVLGSGPPSFFLWTLVTGLCWLSVIWFKCKFKWAVFLPLPLVVLVHTSFSSGVMLMIGVPDEAWMMPGVPSAG